MNAPQKVYLEVVTTKEGNSLYVYFNPVNNVLMVDIVNKSKSKGKELVRMTVDENNMLILP